MRGINTDFYLTSNPLNPKRVNDFMNYLLIIKGKSKYTCIGYTADLSLLFKYLKVYKRKVPSNSEFDTIVINDVDDDFIKSIVLNDLFAFLTFTKRYRKNSAYARARKVASIKSFYRYLVHIAKALVINPADELETPKISKREPIYLSLKQSRVLLQTITGRNKIRDYCIITIFLNCGLRLTELCDINMSSIKDDMVSVIGKGDKERTIYLNKSCMDAIEEYKIVRKALKKNVKPQFKDAFFISEHHNRISKRTVEVLVGKYVGYASLSKKCSPHKLRHTAATLMYTHGVDIRSLQEILGHDSISTTQIYTHVANDTLKKAVYLNPLSQRE